MIFLKIIFLFSKEIVSIPGVPELLQNQLYDESSYCLSIYFFYLSIILSIYYSIYLSIHLSINLSIYLSFKQGDVDRYL